jgi:hypothetical protein
MAPLAMRSLQPYTSRNEIETHTLIAQKKITIEKKAHSNFGGGKKFCSLSTINLELLAMAKETQIIFITILTIIVNIYSMASFLFVYVCVSLFIWICL